MKKINAITLLITLLLGVALLCGCAKKEAPAPAPVAGTQIVATEASTQAQMKSGGGSAPAAETKLVEDGYYVLPNKEEIDGQMTDTSEYLALMPDCTGIYRAQDDIDLTWDGKEAVLADGTKMTLEPIEGGIRVKKDGVVSEFRKTTEPPDDLADKIYDRLLAIDYNGTYVNENQDTIVMKKRDDGNYDITVDIVRLCHMEGDGNNVDGAIEMGLTDPNNNPMYAVFFPDMGTFVMRVTQSTWELLPSQTDITGFVKK